MWKEKRKKKKKERIMPSLVATTSTLAPTTCVRTHYVRTNIDYSHDGDGYSSGYRLIMGVEATAAVLLNTKKVEITKIDGELKVIKMEDL